MFSLRQKTYVSFLELIGHNKFLTLVILIVISFVVYLGTIVFRRFQMRREIMRFWGQHKRPHGAQRAKSLAAYSDEDDD